MPLRHNRRVKFSILWRSDPILGHGSPYGFTITHLGHNALGKNPLDKWSARRRDPSLPDNTQHSQQIDIRALPPPPRIRTRNPTKLTATGIGRHVAIRYC